MIDAATNPVTSAARTWTMYTAPTAARTSKPSLVVLGEAPGADEEASGTPFIGAAGKQLDRSFEEAGLVRAEWHILNTFMQRPPNNDLKHVSWTLNKTEYKKEFGVVPTTTQLKKRYLRPEHQWQLAELDKRLRELKPDLILAMGGTALWALIGEDAITQHRGNFVRSRYGMVLPTLHPASLLYQWSNMPLQWADLTKARKWLEGTLPPPLRRRLWINPIPQELRYVYTRYLHHPDWELGVDIETCPSIDQITTVSFSTAHEGICIPVWDRHAAAGKENFWPTVQEEVAAWRWIERFANLPNPKVMQNGLYDSQYFLDAPIQIRVRNWSNDTAIMQHSYQPELPKALGTLSSLYLNEPSWKQMRQSAKDMNKADE